MRFKDAIREHFWPGTLCVSLLLLAVMASGFYDLEYSDIGVGGEKSVTADYEVIDMVKIEGVSSECQVSDDYSVDPVVAYEEEQAPTSAKFWMLYY